MNGKSINHESKIAHRKRKTIPVPRNRPGLSSALMFCPECRAEYRPGFTRCSDCDIDLVSELFESDIAAEKLKRVWTGKDQARCAAICKGFREAGIPFKVDQHRQQYLQAVDEQYTIGVPAKFFEKARKAVKANLDFPD